MLICVCVKPVLRTDLPFRTGGPGGVFHAIRTDDSLPVANPADMAALATALGLKSRLPDGAIMVVSAEEAATGKAPMEAPLEGILRAALAAGADRVARIWLEPSRSASSANPPGGSAGGLEEATAETTWHNARGVAQALRPMAPRLILTGEKSADSGRGCFGAFLAHQLGADFAHRVSRIDPIDGHWRVTARLEGGYGQEMIVGRETASMPAVVTVAGPPGKLPYPSLPAWIASRTAEIPVIRVSDSSVPSVASVPSAAGGGESGLRVPMPRVKSYSVPEGSLSAEERIGFMVGEDTPAGSTVFAEGSPEEQAEAAVAMLQERGMVE